MRAAAVPRVIRAQGADWSPCVCRLPRYRQRCSRLSDGRSIGPTQSSPACNHSIAVLEFDTAAIQFAARRHPASLAFAALPIQAIDVGKIHGCCCLRLRRGGVDGQIAWRCQVTHPFVGMLRSLVAETHCPHTRNRYKYRRSRRRPPPGHSPTRLMALACYTAAQGNHP
jgi:hypothetical protein